MTAAILLGIGQALGAIILFVVAMVWIWGPSK
jgi:hypothetical protein